MIRQILERDPKAIIVILGLNKNPNRFKNFLEEIGKESKKDFSAIGSKFNNCFQWIGVDPLNVINLLNKFKHFPSDTGHNSKSFAAYIKKMNNMKEINNFTVTLLGNGTYDQLLLFNKYTSYRDAIVIYRLLHAKTKAHFVWNIT